MALFKISKGVTANSRFYIIHRLLMELLPSLGLLLLFLLYRWRRGFPYRNIRQSYNQAAVFFSLGLAGVLPILTTMDQSSYFLLLSLPFFAIALGLLVNPFVEIMIEKINYKSSGFKIFKISGVAALSSALVLSVYFSKDFNRDEAMLKDMRIILPNIKENTTINILPEMRHNWSLYCYYARYRNVSLDPDPDNTHKYLLANRLLFTDTLKKRYHKIDLKTMEYDLFKMNYADSLETP